MPKAVEQANYPPVECKIHGIFLEDCDLTGYGDCVWSYIIHE